MNKDVVQYVFGNRVSVQSPPRTTPPDADMAAWVVRHNLTFVHASGPTMTARFCPPGVSTVHIARCWPYIDTPDAAWIDLGSMQPNVANDSPHIVNSVWTSKIFDNMTRWSAARADVDRFSYMVWHLPEDPDVKIVWIRGVTHNWPLLRLFPYNDEAAGLADRTMVLQGAQQQQQQTRPQGTSAIFACVEANASEASRHRADAFMRLHAFAMWCAPTPVTRMPIAIRTPPTRILDPPQLDAACIMRDRPLDVCGEDVVPVYILTDGAQWCAVDARTGVILRGQETAAMANGNSDTFYGTWSCLQRCGVIQELFLCDMYQFLPEWMAADMHLPEWLIATPLRVVSEIAQYEHDAVDIFFNHRIYELTPSGVAMRLLLPYVCTLRGGVRVASIGTKEDANVILKGITPPRYRASGCVSVALTREGFASPLLWDDAALAWHFPTRSFCSDFLAASDVQARMRRDTLLYKIWSNQYSPRWDVQWSRETLYWEAGLPPVGDDDEQVREAGLFLMENFARRPTLQGSPLSRRFYRSRLLASETSSATTSPTSVDAPSSPLTDHLFLFSLEDQLANPRGTQFGVTCDFY